jgi:hypothetical protein
MSSPVIEAFLIDDENEEKIGLHGLSLVQVIQVLEHTHVVIPNRKRRRGVYLIIGRDNSGNCIAIPVESTPQDKLWRPITAWFCKQGELSMLEKRERYK